MFTIGVPTYNRPEYARQAIESAARQTHRDFEIIVSDDSPGDELRDAVRSMGSDRIRYVKNDPPIGVLKKLNDFLVQARHDWLVILCDDDLLEPDFLSAVEEHVRANPDATLVRTRYRLIDGQGRLIREDRVNPHRMSPYEFLASLFLPESRSFKMNISGIAFPRKVLREAGGFKPFYKGWHTDRHAWAELGARGASICDSRALCSVRLHGGSISGSVEPDCDAAVASTLDMKSSVEKIFEGLERRAASAEDRELLRLARERFDAYVRRHLMRSIDQGMMSALEDANGGSAGRCAEIFARTREFDLPVTASSRLYLVLSRLPQDVRRPVLEMVRRHKQRRWNG